MVYGSYFATSRSVQACRASIAMYDQGRTILDQMARQIRCAYAGAITDEAVERETGARRTRKKPKSEINYFSSNPNASNGDFLRFVTTHGFVETQERPAKGLFEIMYRFDRRTGTLFLCRRRFTGNSKKPGESHWKPVAKNIEHLDLKFFDGRRWLRRWDFEDEKRLPSAVRMEVSCRDEDNRRYDYGTVAHISCRRDRVRIKNEH
jgi:hypothetical protein